MALTKSLGVHFRVSNLQGYACKITGTAGGDTTVTVPLTHVAFHLVGNIDESAGYNPAITFSGGTATYGAAPTNTKMHWLVVLGYD